MGLVRRWGSRWLIREEKGEGRKGVVWGLRLVDKSVMVGGQATGREMMLRVTSVVCGRCARATVATWGVCTRRHSFYHDV